MHNIMRILKINDADIDERRRRRRKSSPTTHTPPQIQFYSHSQEIISKEIGFLYFR